MQVEHDIKFVDVFLVGFQHIVLLDLETYDVVLFIEHEQAASLLAVTQLLRQAQFWNYQIADNEHGALTDDKQLIRF